MIERAPHEQAAETIEIRHGHFWIPGERVDTPFGTMQRGPMFVEWQAPPEVTRPFPLILVHGGGGQGTDWLGTPDGRRGWADRFIREGFATYVVDRPGHGRSPHHPDVLGIPGAQTPYQAANFLFAGLDAAETQTQWPWSREIGGAELDQLTAGLGFLLADVAESQRLDGDRLAALLDIVGPAVLVTHSAGAPGGWLAANRRPGHVKAIVAVEPMGPPFVDMPGFCRLDWGLTGAPVIYDPPVDDPSELAAGVQDHQFVGLVGTPVMVLTGSASGAAAFAPPVVDFLNEVGARAELIALANRGITGNGHGLIFEANSEQTIVPVIEWINANVS
jgi:pimeloyl-ACP methyl ester carboxylesterase